jgi:hypothetical protein
VFYSWILVLGYCACYLRGVLFLGVRVLGVLGALDSLFMAFLFLGIAVRLSGALGSLGSRRPLRGLRLSRLVYELWPGVLRVFRERV